VDVGTVIVVDYETVAIAATGGNKETAGKIGGNLSSDELAINEEKCVRTGAGLRVVAPGGVKR
jgi:hypothetical protein